MTASSAKNESTASSRTETGGKYLTFQLADEGYGIAILNIKELVGLLPITHIPQAPEFVKGVINLRGRVIPVVDMRLKLGMEAADYTERTCIIVVEIAGGNGHENLGIVVDSVSEVMAITADEVEEPPAFGSGHDMNFILGMAKKEGGVKILLDIDRVIKTEEIAMLANCVAEA